MSSTLSHVHKGFACVRPYLHGPAEAGELPAHVEPWVGSVYVYVPDVDAAYGRAIELGARSIAAPRDKPYHERQAGFIDAAGNTWWVSTDLG